MAIVKEVTGKTFFRIPDEELGKYALPESEVSQALKEAGIKLGTPATPQETEGQRVLGPHEGSPQPAEARASYAVEVVVVCPYCYSHRVIIADTNVWQYYVCGNCGNTYKA